MTLIGKILTVLIFIMSLLFMAFALSVYMTHMNWKVEAAANKTEVQDLKNTNETLRQNLAKLKHVLATERAARVHAVARIEAHRNQLASEVNQAETRNVDLARTLGLAVATVKATTTSNDALTAEVGGLRSEIRQTQQDRDDKLTAAEDLRDKMHQAEGLRRRLETRGSQMVAQIANMRVTLNRHGLDEHMPLDDKPPKLDGVVLMVKKDYLEISIGSDDGLRKGHKLEVYRGRSYLGRIEIRQVAPDRAVAIILKDYRKGPIKKGDKVATKSNFS